MEGIFCDWIAFDEIGYLFFSSDMPGGYGGFDLYVCEVKKKKGERSFRTGPPLNLGSLNSEKDEYDGQYNVERNQLYYLRTGGDTSGPSDVRARVGSYAPDRTQKTELVVLEDFRWWE